MSGTSGLAERIDRIEADPAIPLASVDLSIVDPERLRLEFDEVFLYFALVEGEVAQNSIDIAAMLPRLDKHDRRFLAAWSTHEAAHSAIFDALRARLHLPVSTPSVLWRPHRSFRVTGALAEIPWLHDVLKLVYLVRGAMHERLTQEAYTRLGNRLALLGETALVRTVTEPIRRQEASHLGYYKAAASAQRLRLNPLQLRLARVVSVLTYAPVGAKPSRRGLCGRVFAEIAGDDIGCLDPVAAIAGRLLGDGRPWDARFVRRAIDKCLSSRGQAA